MIHGRGIAHRWTVLNATETGGGVGCCVPLMFSTRRKMSADILSAATNVKTASGARLVTLD